MTTEVADRLLTVLSTLQEGGRDPQVVLTGGGFAAELYAEVARRADAYAINWTAVDFWWGDERYVSPDSPERNAVQARDALLDK
ncbi:MAG: 6-phosphogluconolactonase, partial [Marmoricola sp.]